MRRSWMRSWMLTRRRTLRQREGGHPVVSALPVVVRLGSAEAVVWSSSGLGVLVAAGLRAGPGLEVAVGASGLWVEPGVQQLVPGQVVLAAGLWAGPGLWVEPLPGQVVVVAAEAAELGVRLLGLELEKTLASLLSVVGL
jgi:hypothetical protein